MKYKINDLIFTERYTHAKNGEGWTQYTTNTGDFDLLVRVPRHIEELGATLVEEPRTMSVDEFPEDVAFNTSEGVLRWTRRMGPDVGGYIDGVWLVDAKGVAICAERELLKSIGTEVSE